MAENLDVLDERDVLPVLEVRVLDKNRKSSFRLRRFTNFPAAETVKDMKTALQLHMPDIKDVENWQIGYVLDRNKKYAIETDDELKKRVCTLQTRIPNVVRYISDKTSSIEETS